MKKALIVFLVLVAVLSTASALSINAPAEIPANINWSFSSVLDSSEAFDYAKVDFDGKEVLTAYPNTSVVKDPNNGVFVISSFVYDADTASNAGLTLYVSYIGLSYGSHTINVKSYKNGSPVSEESATLNAYNPLPSEYKTEVSGQMEQMTTENADLEAKVTALETELAAKTAELNALKETSAIQGTSITEINAKLSNQETVDSQTLANVDQLSGNLSETQATVAEQQDAIDELQGKKSPFAALAVFGGNIFVGLIVIVAIVAIIGLALYIKNNGRGFGSKNSFSFSMPRGSSKRKYDKAIDAYDESATEGRVVENDGVRKGRFSSGSAEEPAPEENRIYMKDIIRR